MIRRPPLHVCRHLRAKKMYAGPAGPGEFTTSAYWCVRTMSAAGPDGDPADEAGCVRGRTCFEEARHG